MTENYEVKLEIFEGPLDLLIHLIHKNEVDIFDIPIATITDQYLEYLDIMKALNIDVAGDFLVMASTLVHIKSKMLLPAKEDEEEDPRIELSDREILDRDVFARHLSPEFLARIKDEDPQLDVNLFQLMDAFKRIMEQRLPGAQLKLKLAQWSIKEKTEVIIALLKKRGAIFFHEIFDADRTVSELIVTFLALLELVHIGLIKIFQPTAESQIRLIPSFDENGES
jgi:segregation and condensation protein A